MILDFVRLDEGARERAALLNDIESFMLALGEAFYFAPDASDPSKSARRGLSSTPSITTLAWTRLLNAV